MSAQYTQLVAQIAQITHRDDLTSQMPNFVGAANELINVRLSLSNEVPTTANDANEILAGYPNLYLYASLISAYEFTNEIDMAQHYIARYENEIERYFITAAGGISPTLVMGGVPVSVTTSATPGITPAIKAYFATVAQMAAATGYSNGDYVQCLDYASGNSAGVLFFVAVPLGTGAADGGSFIDGVGVQWQQLFTTGFVAAKQYGAVGDGVTNDTAAIEAAVAATGTVTIENGSTPVYGTGVATTPTMATQGQSPMLTTDSGVITQRGKTFVAIHEPVANVGASNNAVQAFNGDFKTPNTYQYVITGENTAGNPPFTPESEVNFTTIFELSGERSSGYFASGKNAATFTTGGRTAWNMDTRHLAHAGKAGAWVSRWDVFMNTQDPDILMMRGVPASGLLIGTVRTAQPNVVMQNIEMNLEDNGHSSTGKACVFNMSRNAPDNGKDQAWIFLRGQSYGSEPIDSGLQLTGNWRNGIDFSTSNTIDRAIALKADQSIYFNTSCSQLKGAPQWITGTAYTSGDYVYNALRVYQATSTGTSGGTPPTWTSGTQSDGGVDWEFVVIQNFKGFADSDDGTRIYWDSSNNRLNIDVGGVTKLHINGTVLNMPGLPVFADETAAASLATGDLYQTATGELRIKL